MKDTTMLKYLFPVVMLFRLGSSCTDFYMNFTNHKLSARTMDLGSSVNWTISTWPISAQVSGKLITWPVKYGSVGVTGNWLGDDAWLATSFFGDALNTQGLSCSTLALIDTQYEQPSADNTNVFAGIFCHYAVALFKSVRDLHANMAEVSIYGPAALAQHYVIRDANGESLVIEVVGGKKQVYLDLNDGTSGYGIMTNEPTFDWHLKNIAHYEWKTGEARSSVSIPGNFYPDERFLRTHMIKSGMQSDGLMESEDYQTCIGLTAQVLDSVNVPMGKQLGTDSGGGEGTDGNDHSIYAAIRDHLDPTLYWRDAFNPTFRRLRLADVNLAQGAQRQTMAMRTGPYYVDVAAMM